MNLASAHLGLLLWAIERGAKPEAFGGDRTVVQLTLTDQIEKKRDWWFLKEAVRCADLARSASGSVCEALRPFGPLGPAGPDRVPTEPRPGQFPEKEWEYLPARFRFSKHQ